MIRKYTDSCDNDKLLVSKNNVLKEYQYTFASSFKEILLLLVNYSYEMYANHEHF